MLNEYTSRYLAAQHRDELLREAERDRLARAVTASDEKGAAVRSAGALQVSLFTHLRRAFRGHNVAPAAGKPQ